MTTPFEIHAASAADQAIITAALGATHELIKKVEECKIQMDHYRELMALGEAAAEEREMLRPVTVEAMKERRECNEKLNQIADLLEKQFGISA